MTSPARIISVILIIMEKWVKKLETLQTSLSSSKKLGVTTKVVNEETW